MTLIESLFLNISIFAVPQNKIERNFVNFSIQKNIYLVMILIN